MPKPDVAYSIYLRERNIRLQRERIEAGYVYPIVGDWYGKPETFIAKVMSWEAAKEPWERYYDGRSVEKLLAGEEKRRELYGHWVGPGETTNLAGRPELQETVAALEPLLAAGWERR